MEPEEAEAVDVRVDNAASQFFSVVEVRAPDQVGLLYRITAALHELGHWTGHPDRLDRDLSSLFGSEGYAREELRAEIASLILGSELGIGYDPDRHAGYVDHWVQILTDTPKEILYAAADAERISDYILTIEQKK